MDETQTKNRAKATRLAARHRNTLAEVARLEDRLYEARQKASQIGQDFYNLTVNGKAGEDFSYTYNEQGGLVVLPLAPNPQDCSECGSKLAACDQLLVTQGRPCCDTCAEENTHNDPFDESCRRLAAFRESINS